MKNWVLASLLAVPCLGLGQQSAHAQCYNLAGTFHIKICATGSLKGWCEKFPSCYGPSCGSPGGGGFGGGAGGGGPYGGYTSSALNAPGPWYLYWPYASAGGQMTQPMTFPGWTYENNFNAPAPTGYTWFPAATTAPPVGSTPATQSPAPSHQSVGYYPSYWYGH